jgi:hypothetical protein
MCDPDHSARADARRPATAQVNPNDSRGRSCRSKLERGTDDAHNTDRAPSALSCCWGVGHVTTLASVRLSRSPRHRTAR